MKLDTQPFDIFTHSLPFCIPSLPYHLPPTTLAYHTPTIPYQIPFTINSTPCPFLPNPSHHTQPLSYPTHPYPTLPYPTLPSPICYQTNPILPYPPLPYPSTLSHSTPTSPPQPPHPTVVGKDCALSIKVLDNERGEVSKENKCHRLLLYSHKTSPTLPVKCL